MESIPGKRSGAWVFKNTRMPVSTVFENLQDMGVDELVEELGVTREQLEAVLQFVMRSLDTPNADPARQSGRCPFERLDAIAAANADSGARK